VPKVADSRWPGRTKTMQLHKNQSPASSEAGTLMTEAAAQAAGRGLFNGVLQSNPLVALGALLLGPVIRLFQRRTSAPREINQLELKTYSSRPLGFVPAVQPQSSRGPAMPGRGT